MEYKSYMSLQVIADKLLRHPMMAGIAYEAIIDYAIDFMRIVQCGGFFEERCTLVKIDKHKGLLPQDFYEIKQVRLASKTPFETKQEVDYGYDQNGNIVSMDTFHDVLDHNNDPVYKGTSIPNGPVFKHSEDTFYNSTNKTVIDLTYKIQGEYIFTSLKEGMIEVSYKAILLDNEGYPMVPDNSKFSRALQAYIKKEWFTVLFDMGKIHNSVLQNVQQEYAWAVGACESEYQHLTLDKAESFYKDWRSLIPITNRNKTRFI